MDRFPASTTTNMSMLTLRQKPTPMNDYGKEPEHITPFRFKDLPRELRDHIYKFLFDYGTVCLVCNRIKCRPVTVDKQVGIFTLQRVTERTYTYSTDLTCFGSLDLQVFEVSRQMKEEAETIFYRINTLDFQCQFRDVRDEIGINRSPRFALRFLRSRTQDTLLRIRNISLFLFENISFEGKTTLRAGGKYRTDRDFHELCVLITTRCQIRYLKLLVFNSKGFLQSEFDIPQIDDEPYKGLPGWIRSLLRIRFLHRLTLSWNYDNVSFVGRTIESAKAMRSAMLENGHTMKKAEGMKILLRHATPFNVDERRKYRSLNFSMDIDRRGRSNLEHVRRAKVDPYKWCENCGRFETYRRYCGCQAHDEMVLWDQCNLNAGKPVCLCGSPWKSQEQEARKTERVVHLVQREDSIMTDQELLDDGVWDNRKWGGKPLCAYLPKDVSVEELYNSQEFADAGYHLVVEYEGEQRGYNESDFGDTDSLRSVHGWSDDEND